MSRFDPGVRSWGGALPSLCLVGIVFTRHASSALQYMSVGQIGYLSDLHLLVCMMQLVKSLWPFFLLKFNQLTSLQHQPRAGLCTRLRDPVANTADGDLSSRCLHPPQDRARRYRNMSATLLARRSYLQDSRHYFNFGCDSFFLTFTVNSSTAVPLSVHEANQHCLCSVCFVGVDC